MPQAVAATPGREKMGTNVSPEQVARASGTSLARRIADAARYVVTGVGPENFFGPHQPLAPFAQDPAQGVVGRQFDYPTGVNLRIPPRATEEIGFNALRGLAESYDLLRLVIETRKDQVESYEWEIAPVDPEADADTMRDDIKRVTDFLTYPDKEHSWSQWLRMVLEDLLVIDAIAVFPTQSKGGELYALDLVDGATIKRVVDQYGRTPLPPSPAFQQVIKGVPAVDYTRDELVYIMRNPRTWKLYGFSPVEQVITTVNIAMRRQLHQLQFYTEGSIPEAIASVPEGWTNDQVREFQAWWDSTMEGNTAARRHIKFVPTLDKIVFPKEAAIKDEYDEWLARVICFAFSLPPTAFIKQTNRATGQQVAETAKEEGLMPLLRWLGLQITFFIHAHLKAPHLKFTFKLQPAVDPVAQATTDKTYIDAKVKTPDEVRETLGLDPLSDADREKNWPTPPDPFGGEGGPPGAGGKPGAPKPPGIKAEATKDDAEKHVHIHQGDTIIRMPSIDVPTPHVVVNGALQQQAVRKTMSGRRDKDGKMVAEITEHYEDGTSRVVKTLAAVRAPDGSMSSEIIEKGREAA